MFGDADGADSRSASTMGTVGVDVNRGAHTQTSYNSHSEGLVQVHVADVATTLGGVSETNLGVEVGTVEVDSPLEIFDDASDDLGSGENEDERFGDTGVGLLGSSPRGGNEATDEAITCWNAPVNGAINGLWLDEGEDDDQVNGVIGGGYEEE